MIASKNYKTLEVNDSLSVLIYEKYIELLDQGHNYLLQSDIVEFSMYKTVLDDNLKAGNLDNALQIFNRYRQRYREAIEYALVQLKPSYSFSQKETVVLDRSLLPYPKDRAELEVIWRKHVKYDLLVLSKISSDETENKKILMKRYQNLLVQDSRVTNQDFFQIFMNAVTSSVDPHIAYFNPFNAAEFDVSMSRSLEGIGATLALENGFIVVKSLVAGGPAAKTKLITPEDRIIAISEGNDGDFKDVLGWRVNDVISLIRGKKGSIVRLKLLTKLQTETDIAKIVAITRAKVILEDLSAKKEIREYDVNGKKTKIGIITIPQFYMDYKAYSLGDPNYKSTTRDVALIIDSLKKIHVDGILIDLRQNGGGSLTEAIDLTGLFIKTGPVVQVKDVKNAIEVNSDRNSRLSYDGPLAVLVDRLSASASEIFSAALQDYGRGIILGSQTYGKGTVQQDLDLDQVIKTSRFKQQAAALAEQDQFSENSQSLFGQFNITIGKFYRINGRSTQLRGVTPDVTFPTLFPLKEYGEESEKSALSWDTIGKADYVVVGNFDEMLPKLNKQHRSRFKSLGLDEYMAEALRNNSKPTHPLVVSLNDVESEKERKQKESRILAGNNQLRKVMGLPMLKNGQLAPLLEDLDYIKREAGEVLTDYILSTHSKVAK
ncbi:carboxy terminal-processing peptidase [Pedobacter sp. P26]|uniref:carboxy terminal-processing peptidase n=1 Tax=Pedobacter sp. P26 TaxID=3423956 RepID=UPI003D67737E